MSDSNTILNLCYAQHARQAIDFLATDIWGREIPGMRIEVPESELAPLGKFLAQKEMERA